MNITSSIRLTDTIKENILGKGNKNDHNIIINRNLSFHLYKRKNNKICIFKSLK